jgi:Fe-S-cluster-containing hydrogenase component 2
LSEIRLVVPNQELCNGCRICELACSYEHFRVANPRKSRIRVLREGYDTNKPNVCRLCGRPPCVEACPRKALSKIPDTHTILVDESRCVAEPGDPPCVRACPWKAISIDSERRIALVCDLCGQSPVCVEICPTHALNFGTLEQLVRRKKPEPMHAGPIEG